MYGLKDERQESSPTERELGVVVGSKLNLSQQCALSSPKGQLYPGVHQAQHCQLGEGRDCPTLLCAGVASPQALSAVLGATA